VAPGGRIRAVIVEGVEMDVADEEDRGHAPKSADRQRGDCTYQKNDRDAGEQKGKAGAE
jgi:hypothetical protein